MVFCITGFAGEHATKYTNFGSWSGLDGRDMEAPVVVDAAARSFIFDAGGHLRA
jgi:hypothetical protein